jgi:hypothetical protein
MLNRRQAIAAACGAAATAVLPAPAKTVPFVVGPLLYNHDESAWIDAETLRRVLGNQHYKTVVLPHGWKITRLPPEAK